MGGNDIGVYLLAGEKEILLGNIFIRGGSGEFRTVVTVSDVEHSGIPMDQCYGLTVHDVENTWRSYTTIWEDAVAHAAEVELSNTLPEKKEREETAQEAQIKKAMKEIEEEFPVEAVQETKEIEKQDKMSREQLKAFTESAREQSKAFAESIRKQVEQSADTTEQTAEAVSYTHLDVYKRQLYGRALAGSVGPGVGDKLAWSHFKGKMFESGDDAFLWVKHIF